MLRCASAAKGWPSVAAWVRRRPRTKESPKTVGIMGRTIAEFGSASACGAVRRLMRRRSCAGAHGGAWRASRGRPLCGVARASPPATFDANQRAAFDHGLPQSTRARRVQNHMESDAAPCRRCGRRCRRSATTARSCAYCGLNRGTPICPRTPRPPRRPCYSPPELKAPPGAASRTPGAVTRRAPGTAPMRVRAPRACLIRPAPSPGRPDRRLA